MLPPPNGTITPTDAPVPITITGTLPGGPSPGGPPQGGLLGGGRPPREAHHHGGPRPSGFRPNRRMRMEPQFPWTGDARPVRLTAAGIRGHRASG
jgi:hypothetical protein